MQTSGRVRLFLTACSGEYKCSFHTTRSWILFSPVISSRDNTQMNASFVSHSCFTCFSDDEGLDSDDDGEDDDAEQVSHSRLTVQSGLVTVTPEGECKGCAFVCFCLSAHVTQKLLLGLNGFFSLRRSISVARSPSKMIRIRMWSRKFINPRGDHWAEVGPRDQCRLCARPKFGPTWYDVVEQFSFPSLVTDPGKKGVIGKLIHSSSCANFIQVQSAVSPNENPHYKTRGKVVPIFG